MTTAHWIIQGKGGVGKSLIAALLAQYLAKRFVEAGYQNAGDMVHCFDTDPVNGTFASYKALCVSPVNIMRDDDEVDERKFDELMEQLFALPLGAHAVIDNGASCFLKLCGYLKETDAFGQLSEAGLEMVLHTVVTGGQAVGDTLNGMAALAKNFSGYPIVVWRNSYFGNVEYDGVDLEDLGIWKRYVGNLHAVVNIPNLSKNTFGVDLQNLFGRRQTFAEAADSPSLRIMERARLRQFWTRMCDELSRASVAEPMPLPATGVADL